MASAGPVDLSQFSNYAEVLAYTRREAENAIDPLRAVGDALKNAIPTLSQFSSAVTKTIQTFIQQQQMLGSALQRVVNAGIAGTNEGNRLSFTWMLFSRQIASVFLPTINYVIAKLQELTQWFKSLTGDQQRLIESLGMFALGLAMLAPILSVLMVILSPLNLLITALAGILYVFFTQSQAGKDILEAMNSAVKFLVSLWQDLVDVFDLVKFSIGVAIDSVLTIIVGFVATVSAIVGEIVSYIPGLGGVADAISAFAESAKKEAESLYESANKDFKPRDRSKGSDSKNTQVNPSGFGFESLSASFERITSAANKQDLARETLEVQKKQLEQQVAMVAGIGSIQGGAKLLQGDH